MVGRDPIAGETERIERCTAAGLHRRIDLLGRDRNSGSIEIELVKFACVVLERGVAARRDIGDDRAHGCLDVGGGLALGVEKGAEFPRKIAGANVETNGHWELS
jgi:hypothetical protein